MKKLSIIIFLFSIFSFCLGAPLEIEIEDQNSNQIGLYQKFEVIANIENADYSNPYNPEEISLEGVFISPEGKKYKRYGFYDDYKDVSEWKLRFSPDKTGKWKYYLKLKNDGKTVQSDKKNFTAVESEHKGWLSVSNKNSKYLQHDNGESFYGVGAYYPWDISLKKLDTLARNGMNLFALWNINYGEGILSEAGYIEHKLGQYNQKKAGRMDKLFQKAEELDMKIKLCIWPHDLVSKTVWAHQWHNNPYKNIVDVENFYGDSLAWEYQKKQYRYLIARYGYSRSLGIWEIINEMNGTDGWQQGNHREAFNWVDKVDDFLNKHDPHNRATTASFSGAKWEYRPELFQYTDIQNIHLYQNQGWYPKYKDNLMRSSLKNYAFASQRFWNNIDKPGIFGETGYTHTYYGPESEKFSTIIHNALWSSLTNGLAATPLWWTVRLLSEEELVHYKAFSKFVSKIDFIDESKQHFQKENDEYDLYGMIGDSKAFGWIRDAQGKNLAGKKFKIDEVIDRKAHNFQITFFNTRTGDKINQKYVPNIFDKVITKIPDNIDQQDIAFIIKPAQDGKEPEKLKLISAGEPISTQSKTYNAIVFAIVTDSKGRLCSEAEGKLEYNLKGPGKIERRFSKIEQIEEGETAFRVFSTGKTGTISIEATAEGYGNDKIDITAENFE